MRLLSQISSKSYLIAIVGLLAAVGGFVLFTPLISSALWSQTAESREPPYPPSPVITNLAWAPPSSIVRAAEGSDTFPVTWADDGNLYTAFADGWGFEPQVAEKLSLGFARVEGPATGFTGINIISPDQQVGQGAKGKKASGMLMVDSILYMWVRNANNNGQHCQLAWSEDHAQSWTWSSWKFEEFGYCTFINYGQNYAGGPAYVYVVTHDNPSAYEAADHFVLMRVLRDEISHRDAYEFFQELDENGDPVWTADIDERGAVFTHSDRALRSGISFNAALQRYLWWQQIPGSNEDTRFAGGFGVYDAPQPWGPWTTVYYTEAWDVGPGETASFPTKWMSADGKTLYLVFSGDDAFSVRKATLTTAETVPATEELPTETPTAPITGTDEPANTTTNPSPSSSPTPLCRKEQ